MRATPPKLFRVALGRINTLSCCESQGIRVLSPNILPPETFEEGSIAKTANFNPFSKIIFPKASIKVLFPTPGTPVIPILQAFLLRSEQLLINLLASFLSSET